MKSDLELVSECQTSRSSEALAEIVARHGAMVYRACLRQSRNTCEAEDLTQAVFLLLLEQPELVRGPLVDWLHRSARGVASNFRRAEMRRARREELASMCKRVEHKRSENCQLSQELDGALAALPGRCRDAVILRYMENRELNE